MKRSAGNVWHRLACAVLIVLGAQMAAADSYLLWAFDDEEITAQDGETTLKVDELALGDKAANAIRVKQVLGEDESYLQLSYGEMDIGKTWFIDDDFRAGPGYARIGAVDSLTKFMIEIGNLTNEDWTTLAASEALTYSQLQDLNHIWYDAMSVPTGEDYWHGVFSVPEPSGALLLLFGGACVALRRRRREVAFK